MVTSMGSVRVGLEDRPSAGPGQLATSSAVQVRLMQPTIAG